MQNAPGRPEGCPLDVDVDGDVDGPGGVGEADGNPSLR